MPLLMPSTFSPMENGDYLLLGPDRDENIREITRHSPRDADAMDRYEHDVTRVQQLIQPLFDNVPPNIFGKSAEDARRHRLAARSTSVLRNRKSSTTLFG